MSALERWKPGAMINASSVERSKVPNCESVSCLGVLPVFVMVVLFVAVLVSYPWQVLAVGSLAYLAALPLGWLSYRRLERAAAAAG